jgi:hypothetical protein
MPFITNLGCYNTITSIYLLFDSSNIKIRPKIGKLWSWKENPSPIIYRYQISEVESKAEFWTTKIKKKTETLKQIFQKQVYSKNPTNNIRKLKTKKNTLENKYPHLKYLVIFILGLSI